MTELLNSYTFEAKKIVYYSVTVGANNKAEAKSEDEARDLVNKDVNNYEVIDEKVSDWEINLIEELV